MRLLFAGTPETAVPSLEALLASRHEVAAVLTRPDAPAGRGRRLMPSAVADAAAQAGLEVLKPASVRTEEFAERLRALRIDAVAVVAYGALLPRSVLDIPPHGWVNLHFSLLPAWRGAAPVQAAIRAGDEITGASTFLIEPDLDSGPVFGTVTEQVRATDTAGELLARLAISGAGLLVATMNGVGDGTLVPQPQRTDGVSYAGKITAADARVDFAQPAFAVDRLIRSVTPAPGAWVDSRWGRLVLGPVRPATGQRGDSLLGRGRTEGRGEQAADTAPPAAGTAPPAAGTAPPAADTARPAADPTPPAADTAAEARAIADRALAPGEIVADKHRVWVTTATTPVLLSTVQAPGKRAMPAADWARGARLAPGDRLGTPGGEVPG